MSLNVTQNLDHHTAASTYPISMYTSTADYINPLRSTSNRLLINKDKLNPSLRNMESSRLLPVKEKIYYNPKFLLNHVKTAAGSFISANNEPNDTKIHINRNYLANLNLSNYTTNNSKPQSRGGIYINPKFINRPVVKEAISNVPNNDILLIKNSDKNNIKSSPCSKSKYKFVKSVSSPKSSYKFIKTIQSPPKPQISPKPLCIKTKYSLKRLNVAKTSNKDLSVMKSPFISRMKTIRTIAELNKSNKMKLVRKTSSEFKKLSSTKLVRKSVLQSLILARRHSGNKLFRKFTYAVNKKSPKRKSTNLLYFPKSKIQKMPPYEMYKNDNLFREKYKKINNIASPKNENNCNSSFKKLGKMKIVRKSLLKAQIEARNQVRKQYLLDYRNWMKKSPKFNNARNDSLRRKFVDKQKALLNWRKKKTGPDVSRVKCKRTSHANSSKHLRKNNQPCPFYNRFGRCKGKDKGTCPKLHDPLYISICRKLLQGECNTKDCLLSHDIRPGKMPTCHHYLAGLCTRPNCPYLHIKVNPKAPICTAFLQGYCPDISNCLKRHEFICPIYAEKGNCPRGKSCTYPHRSPVVHSKLLKDDQKPLIKRTTDDDSSINITSTNLETQSNKVNNESSIKKATKLNSINNRNKVKKEYVKEAFTRYFAVTNTDETCDSSNVVEESIETVVSCEDSQLPS